MHNDRAESNENTMVGRSWTSHSLRTLRRERLTRRHIFEQIETDGTTARVLLDRNEMVIGRAPDAQIRLTSKKASRHHVILRVRGTDCVMLDNDSDNGVLLNGVNVHSAVLRDGDVIHVADSVFVYREE
jgi:pSer/pThr/pTyr-binding forkhead associated (FHA) protein